MKHLEIERKILGINVRALIGNIKKLSPRPRKIFEGKMRVLYFDFSDSRIRKKGDLLRIRMLFPKKGRPFSELVYKIHRGVQNQCKYQDEIEWVIPGTDDAKKLGAFLGCLGLKQTVLYEKKRTLFQWGKIHFEIDEHPRIAPFLEIEAPSPAHIEKAIRLLGLQKNEQTAESIGALMRRKYPRISLHGLTFSS